MEPRLTMLAVGVLLLTYVGAPAAPHSPHLPPLCFYTDGQTICISEPFRSYWVENGALPRLGYPITQPQVAQSSAGSVITQYFEYARLEFFPDRLPGQQVQPGRLGAELYGEQAGTPQEPQEGCRYFPETNLNLCEPFLSFWLASGAPSGNRSLEVFGLPLSAPQAVNNGQQGPMNVQWFERARLELYPDGQIRLGQLGRELHQRDADRVLLESNDAQPTPVPTEPTPTEVLPTPLPTDSVPVPTEPEPTPESLPTIAPQERAFVVPSGGAPVPSVPCNRNVPAPQNGLQIWVANPDPAPPEDAVICVRLLDERGQPVQGIAVQTFRHTPEGEVPSIHHTTGFEGVADFIYYLGDLPKGYTVQVRAVSGYGGRTFEAWTSFVRR